MSPREPLGHLHKNIRIYNTTKILVTGGFFYFQLFRLYFRVACSTLFWAQLCYKYSSFRHSTRKVHTLCPVVQM